MELLTPVIKAYTKEDIRYLLRNPHTDLSTRRCKHTGEVVKPISNTCLKQNLIQHLDTLRIASEKDYNHIRYFTPSQVQFIFEILL